MAKTPTPLQRTASEFPTDYWNDSCNKAELEYAIENGAVGATSNPVIVGTVMQQEYDFINPRFKKKTFSNFDRKRQLGAYNNCKGFVRSFGKTKKESLLLIECILI